MSIRDLHDLAAKLHDYREDQRSRGFAGSSEESKLIAATLLQAVRELRILQTRLNSRGAATTRLRRSRTTANLSPWCGSGARENDPVEGA